MEYRILELLKDIKNDINNKPKEDKWLDITQASNYTNLSKSTLRRYIKDGKLKASNKLGKTLFKQSELENWLNG
tara:strand:- start:1180 stop:1401 length:222 start_codon:yes stop_codon:yes gene_type:complete